MMWRNSHINYGAVSKLLHWLVALAIIGLFALGLWMVELDYYHSWYRKAPDLHRSIGLLLMAVTALRLIWLVFAGKPIPLATHRRWEVVLARGVHALMYVLVFATGLAGYLISTADGRPVHVFDWFAAPSSGEWIESQEDVAGEVHELLAFGLIAMAAFHALAALKHHFVDRDATLRRML